MNDPFISQKVQDIFDRPRFPRVWRALRARTRAASHVENPGNPQESSALHYPDQTGGQNLNLIACRLEKENVSCRFTESIDIGPQRIS